jgi:hypothetical protein
MGKKVKATLFISEEKREKIKRSGLSLEEYCDKIYDAYENFRMETWENGCFMMDHFRVTLLRAETLNSILNNIEDNKQHDLGKELGGKLQLTLREGFKQTFNAGEDFSRKMIDYLNAYSGWGLFSQDKGTVIITMPIFTKPHFIQGYLEGLFNIELTVVESLPDRMIFTIKGQVN